MIRGALRRSSWGGAPGARRGAERNAIGGSLLRRSAPERSTLAARSGSVLGAPPRIIPTYGAERSTAPGQVSIDAGSEVGEITLTPGERVREAGRTVWRSVVTPALILWAVCRWVSCPVRREGRRAALAAGYGPETVARMTKRLTVMIALRAGLVALAIGAAMAVAWRNDLLRWPVLVALAVAWLASPALAGLGRPPAPAAPVVQAGPDYSVLASALENIAGRLTQAAQPVAPVLDPLQQAFVDARITTAGRPVMLLEQEDRDDGQVALIDLGSGAVVSDAQARHAGLASALDVPVERLHLAGTGRRLVLRIADRDPFEKRRPSPLLRAEQWDPWTPVPIGVDAAQAVVSLRMLEQAVLIAGLPRHGKTTLARILAGAGLLHAGTGLSLWSAKGNGDWVALEPVADRWAVGGDTAGDLADGLAEISAEVEATYRLMKGMKVGEITPEMVAAGDVRCRLLVVDELQHYLGDATHGRDILGRLANIARLGPAAGVMVVAAPHRPDATAVPSQLRAQFGVRVAFRVQDPDDAKVILGRRFAGPADPTTINRRGEAIVLGSHERPGEPVRALIDAFDLDDLDNLVVHRPDGPPRRHLRAARPADQDTRSTEPAGTERPFDGVGEGPDLIRAALGAFLPSEDRLWTEDIARRIGWPGKPGTLGTAIIRAARDAGANLRSHQIKLLGDNRWGFHRAELEVAAEVVARVAVVAPTAG